MSKALVPAGGNILQGAEYFDENPMEISGFLFSGRGAKATGKPTIKQYQKALLIASASHEASPYWVADLVAYADTRQDWREKLSQAHIVTGLSEKTLHNLGYLGRHVGLKARKLAPTPSHAAEVASLPPAEQHEWLSKSRDEGWTRQELRAEIRAAKRRGVIEGQAVLEGRYRVIYADPPWRYGDAQKSGSRARDHYPDMSIDEICALPVGSHAMPHAVLFMWATAPILLENPGPREVVEAWGFTPKAQIIWDKVEHNVGSYVSVRHEILIIAVRGLGRPDRPTPMVDSVQTVRHDRTHSGKPEDFRKIIERLYDGPYLELFARRQVKGWTCWGNQVLKEIGG